MDKSSAPGQPTSLESPVSGLDKPLSGLVDSNGHKHLISVRSQLICSEIVSTEGVDIVP